MGSDKAKVAAEEIVAGCAAGCPRMLVVFDTQKRDAQRRVASFRCFLFVAFVYFS